MFNEIDDGIETDDDDVVQYLIGQDTDDEPLISGSRDSVPLLASSRFSLKKELFRIARLAFPIAIARFADSIVLAVLFAFVARLPSALNDQAGSPLEAFSLCMPVMMGSALLVAFLPNALHVLLRRVNSRQSALRLIVSAGFWTLLLGLVFVVPLWAFLGDAICALGVGKEEGSLLTDNNGLRESSSLLCAEINSFSRVSILWLFPLLVHSVLNAALESVGVVWIPALISITLMVFTIGISYVLAFIGKMGLGGLALSLALSKTLLLFLVAGYAFSRKRVRRKLFGSSDRGQSSGDGDDTSLSSLLFPGPLSPATATRSFLSLSSVFLRLAIPMILSEALWQWLIDLGSLIAGLWFLSAPEIAAVAWGFATFELLLPVSTALYYSSSIRVSTSIALQQPHTARRICYLALVISLVFGALLFLVVEACSSALLLLFGADGASHDSSATVMAMKSSYLSLLPLVCSLLLTRLLNDVLRGTLEAQHRALTVTIVSAIAGWVLGVPLLIFMRPLKSAGIFCALFVAELMKFIIFSICLWRSSRVHWNPAASRPRAGDGSAARQYGSTTPSDSGIAYVTYPEDLDHSSMDVAPSDTAAARLLGPAIGSGASTTDIAAAVAATSGERGRKSGRSTSNVARRRGEKIIYSSLPADSHDEMEFNPQDALIAAQNDARLILPSAADDVLFSEEEDDIEQIIPAPRRRPPPVIQSASNISTRNAGNQRERIFAQIPSRPAPKRFSSSDLTPAPPSPMLAPNQQKKNQGSQRLETQYTSLEDAVLTTMPSPSDESALGHLWFPSLSRDSAVKMIHANEKLPFILRRPSAPPADWQGPSQHVLAVTFFDHGADRINNSLVFWKPSIGFYFEHREESDGTVTLTELLKDYFNF